MPPNKDAQNGLIKPIHQAAPEAWWPYTAYKHIEIIPIAHKMTVPCTQKDHKNEKNKKIEKKEGC
jgi:hypothetical protein